jgi:SAM-dependent methyltransferase
MKRCLSCNTFYASSKRNCSSCDFAPALMDGFDSYAPDFALDGGGFKSNYFSELARLEETNFWFRSRNQLIMWAVEKYFKNFKLFLEIGCGTGYVLSGVSKKFRHATIYGSEIFITGLSFAAARLPSAKLMQMDARNIPFENEFDLVGAFDVIEHIKEDKVVLQNIFRAIKPGGGLLVTVPQHQWLWSAADDHACHERRYSADDLHAKLQENGFEIIRSTSFVSLLFPAMMLSRRRGRSGKKFDALGEFRINPIINNILELVMALERWLIQLGINIPFGGSRLVVARRPF